LVSLLAEIRDAYPDEFENAVQFCNETKALSKKAKWEELIDSGRLGYQATLMNLRNILKYDVGMAYVEKVANFLSSPAQVAKSKMFPFRYLSARRSLHKMEFDMLGYGAGRGINYKPLDGFKKKKVDVITEALEQAAALSINNVDFFLNDQAILIACDVSGSMQVPVSRKSTIQNYDIGLLLGMLLKKKYPQSTIGIFCSNWEVLDDKMESAKALAQVDYLHNIEGRVGYSTHGFKVLEYALQAGIKFDKIMMFTDCQMYNDSRNRFATNSVPELWAQYKALYPEAKLYMFDLSGYGTTPLEINENDVYLIAGWNNEIFNVLKNLENGKDALSNINSIEI
jgi:hypothetical protein